MMKKTWRQIGWLMLVVGLAGCAGAAAEVATPTPPAAIAGDAPAEPPDVDDIAPAGQCEDTANIISLVERDEDSLFRALAHDNRAGPNDGDGIVGVRFVVIGDRLAYTKLETEAPYCIFGGNEPDCPPWPRDAQGQYTWGVDGSVVQPGEYHVMVEVQGQWPDSATGAATCDWTFEMTIR